MSTTEIHDDKPTAPLLGLGLGEGLGDDATERRAYDAWFAELTFEKLGRDDKAWIAWRDRAASALVETGHLRHALAQSGKLAEDRLQQMKADRAQALIWRGQLDRALVVCRCAARVIDSSAYQGVSDEDCDLEAAVRNWRASGPNEKGNRPA